ncbi:MAG: hypothetical protein ACO1OY_13600 [Ramlibacter sp.]
MNTTENPAAPSAARPKIYLLWRDAAREALQAGRRAAGRVPAVLVRLVDQPVDRQAVRAAGLRLVTLPMAFAGLTERDQVLRDAVARRLREPEAAC